MKKWTRRISWVLGSLFAILILCCIIAYALLRSSLPRLEGNERLAGLHAKVDVTRDALGVPTFRARDRIDAIRALGFVHAQERFFQMDTSRRLAAGELSALVGRAALETDQATRVHRFRYRARVALERLPSHQRDVIEAYAEGVNAGLQALGRKPFEYFALRSIPEPWKSEDSILVGYTMYLLLQGGRGEPELTRKFAREKLPPALFAWLDAQGGEWDAPLVGEALPATIMPNVDQLAGFVPKIHGPVTFVGGAERDVPGSNNWAVSGKLSRSGSAMVANDMHLGLSVPNTWFRARLWYGEGADEVRITGVTLPGVPAIIVGSNEHIAWGFTNSYGDWADIIALDLVDRQRYRTSTGEKTITVTDEEITIHGEASVRFPVEETEWGPVIRRRGDREAYVQHWVAYDPDHGMDVGLEKLERAQTAKEAVALAKLVRMPQQNLVVADKDGSIAWTIIGAVPRRVGYDGRDVVSWSDGTKAWQGYSTPEEVPDVINPPDGRIWTANNRVVSGDMVARLGNGGYSLGARGKQIRDRLREREVFEERDMLAIQMDDEATFLQRWHKQLVGLLDDAAIANSTQRTNFRKEVENWGGHASSKSAGYRFVRAYRTLLRQTLHRAWFAACYEADEHFEPYLISSHWEEPLWQAVSQEPQHLLPQPHATWRTLELSIVDALIQQYEQSGGLRDRTWGEINTTRIRHPLSNAVPFLSRWLDAPADALNGDVNMPYIQGRNFGASERMIVSPGHEEQAIFHMPTGQSAHPLSPFFMAGHSAWVKGEATAFLPGPAKYQLTLEPSK